MRLLVGRHRFGPMEGRNRLRRSRWLGCREEGPWLQSERRGLFAHGVAFTRLEITTAVDTCQVIAQGSKDAEYLPEQREDPQIL